MPLIKKVQNANPGDVHLYGGNDLDIISDYFNDADTGNVPRINNPTEFRSGILKVRDGSNTYNVILKSATQTNSRDFTIPALIGNDSPATLALPNEFTAIQTINSDNQRLIKMYRPVSTTNSTVGFEYQFRNANNVQTTYAYALGKLVTNTAGLEDGSWAVHVMKAGVITKVLEIDKNGLLTVNSISVAPPATNTPEMLMNSGAIVTTASSASEFDMLNYTVAANKLGANGNLRCFISGYLLQNQASATDYTIKVKFGGTIIYNALTNLVQGSANLPFRLSFDLGNNNATNAQSMSGSLILQDTGTTGLTTGEGCLENDEISVNANFRATTGASTKDTTANQALVVTMQHSVNNANVVTSVQRKYVEFLPGV